MERQRNNTLEIIKLVASYMVVLIHFYFRDGVGSLMDALARFAVPLFFVVSGFYSYQISLSKIKKRTKNIIWLSLFSTLLYTAFNITRLLLSGNAAGIPTYFERYLNLKVLVRLFVFNIPLSSEHLWFLFALIYVYVIFYLVTKYKISDAWVWGISVFFLFLHILLGEFALAFGVDSPTTIIRNFLLMGVPFFGLGLMAKKYEQKIRKTPNLVVFAILVLGILETCFSRKSFGKNELYIGSILICFSAIALFVKYSNKKYPNMLVEIAGCNTYIYILHLLVISVTKTVCSILEINLLPVVSYLIVCLVSTILAYCTNKINKKLKDKFYKDKAR